MDLIVNGHASQTTDIDQFCTVSARAIPEAGSTRPSWVNRLILAVGELLPIHPYLQICRGICDAYSLLRDNWNENSTARF